ncbi:MAG: NAD(P)(+) transhydrogenase (Re/Si-specific) subunit alpha, partial [Bacteroidales bacterium]
MNIGLLKETGKERRVALLPEIVTTLVKMNVTVNVEHDAGSGSYVPDADYVDAGAKILSKKEVIENSDFIIKLNGPTDEEIGLMKKDQCFLGVFNPLTDHAIVKKIMNAGITAFSMDVIPRTSRAQAMDILSSMATVNGYKAVLTAAN